MKSDRRLQLLSAAERLFAERGFLAVRLEDIGASAGVSGPAIYRHFPNKESLLVELLVGISTRLLAGARQVRARSADAAAALDGLIDFHLDFALNEPDLIRIQDRDLAYLPKPAERQVRKAQRQYVEVWVGVLRELNPELAEADARLTAHAVFGLLNSTPHSMKSQDSGRGKPARAARSRAIMRAMTVAALAAGNQCP
ncbi:TetR family transcriptional regulator [Mycobacterium avium subsp. hominissuis 101]|uniref:Transcriptional regulator, TetR family protein n=1 Tax=Mycobacterium avium (strain 104) TaxID=243243 RepID=A0A0H2ZT17_MYCA1|nr:transcriptional regulator, TetR family protein [Mycobacterium avium 104]ETZ43160.1 bacterial regulatory s, tetR family protein [Mycobacterium avium MAV_120809_2495]EUA39431.1 bacterial regulatory s, tetR family protein [Mycobacterium avium subsp. avium 2285 (R)]KDO96620.1 TetR family transcriptional regulator [Mycobacterium avium subsp. hominissuis A5]KDP00869.1 TetR family transcriptional regulator [Mycobacterium avium subsp. hominissuis 3388]KDP07299.1 TetR family transcriptional regulato